MRLTEQVDLDIEHLNWSGRACELVLPVTVGLVGLALMFMGIHICSHFSCIDNTKY